MALLDVACATRVLAWARYLESRKAAKGRLHIGAGDEIRTRDPLVGNEKISVKSQRFESQIISGRL